LDDRLLSTVFFFNSEVALSSFHGKSYTSFLTKMDLTTFWTIISPTHLVTLPLF
jgi:hypothetical protein